MKCLHTNKGYTKHIKIKYKNINQNAISLYNKYDRKIRHTITRFGNIT
jgi:hypothetical protein